MVRRFGTLDNDWAYLLAIHRLCDYRAGVPDETSDLLDRHAIVGEQRNETVPQFPWRPVLCREPGRSDNLAEATPDIVRIKGRSGL